MRAVIIYRDGNYMSSQQRLVLPQKPPSRVKHQLTCPHSLGTNLSLSTLEISIVSTSLVAITNDLRGFSQSSWVITAYLLTYFGQKPSPAACSELTICERLAHYLGKTQRHTGTENCYNYFNSYLCCFLSSLCSSSDDETLVRIIQVYLTL